MKRCSDYRARASPQEQTARCKEPCNLTNSIKRQSMKRHLQTKAKLFPAGNHAHTHVHQSRCPPSAKNHQSRGLLIAWLQERKEYFWDISVESYRYK